MATGSVMKEDKCGNGNQKISEVSAHSKSPSETPFATLQLHVAKKHIRSDTCGCLLKLA